MPGYTVEEIVDQQFAEVKTFQDAEALLLDMLDRYNVAPDGRMTVIKGLVSRIEGLKVHVYADDHTPPHFHIRRRGESEIRVRIEDCIPLDEGLDARSLRVLRKWWERGGRAILVTAWNDVRPGDRGRQSLAS